MAKAIVHNQLGLIFDQTPAEVAPEPEPTPVLTIPKKGFISGEAARQHMVRLFNGLRCKYGVYDIFRDFCEMAACTISNWADPIHYDEREADYLRIAGRYEREELNVFCEMLATLTQALEGLGPRDVLGQIFQALEINNKDQGQFFTPQNVCECMAAMSLHDCKDVIQAKGYITVCEPAVGGGGMVFAACKVMEEQGLDYHTQLHVSAIDIDDRCANMAYIQMSMLGVPGIVYHGDALSGETRSVWYTPAHITGEWWQRLAADQK